MKYRGFHRLEWHSNLLEKITKWYSRSYEVSKKKCIIRDLGLNLEASENRKILGIIQKMQLKRINKEDAFSQIKAELPNSEEYNDDRN